MPRGTSTQDPIVLRRREQNKIASSRCRERKLIRARFLEKELLDMRSQIEGKQRAVHEMLIKIMDCYQLVKHNATFLTPTEIDYFNQLLEKFDVQEDQSTTHN